MSRRKALGKRNRFARRSEPQSGAQCGLTTLERAMEFGPLIEAGVTTEESPIERFVQVVDGKGSAVKNGACIPTFSRFAGPASFAQPIEYAGVQPFAQGNRPRFR